VVPEKADGYSLTFSEKAQALVGDLSNDPLVKALQEHAHTNRWPQKDFQRMAEVLELAAEKGLLEPPVDAKAEAAKLGKDGEQRQRDMETYLQALQARADVDAEQFAEGMVMSRTAAGMRLLEFFRAQMPNGGKIDPPGDGGAGPLEAQKDAWRAKRTDPKYENDATYRHEVDKEFQRIWGGS
jgi:hypothetical protein